MSKKFYVISQEECQTCEGCGEVYNQAWKEFNARFDRAARPGVDLPNSKAFLRQHGTEFRQCSTCQGTGTDTRQVELTEALAELGLTPALLQRVGELEERFEATR